MQRLVNGSVATPTRTIPYEPMQIVLNVAVSSLYEDVTPNLNSFLPTQLVVDYVRLYQVLGLQFRV